MCIFWLFPSPLGFPNPFRLSLQAIPSGYPFRLSGYPFGLELILTLSLAHFRAPIRDWGRVRISKKGFGLAGSQKG